MHPNQLNPENAAEGGEVAAVTTHTHADGSECGHDHSHEGHGHGHAHAEPVPSPASSPDAFTSASVSVDVDDVVEAMKDVVDPELGINVVDLGLVYGLHVDESGNAVVDMTLTSAACPLTDVIQDQTEMALEGLVADVAINWVWMPPWGPDKITDDGREQLRALGFNV
jgi:metal-sulfur cluster biosynthetic enzyme